MSRCRHATAAVPEAGPSPAEWLAAEPYRVFFPWAALCGVWGVLLWPLFFAKVIVVYPAVPHAHLMAFGFGGAAVLGFLGTAAPRMLGAPALRVSEAAWLLMLHASSVIACALARDVLGCTLFALALASLFLIIGSRFARRTGMPPPAFVLVLLGLLSGLLGAVLLALHVDWQSPFWFRFSRLLSQEAFLLLPILGVGGFLIARILGLPSRQSLPDSRTPPVGWWPLALEALAVGAFLLGTWLLEAGGQIRLGAGLRFVILLLWWSRDTPGLWRTKTIGTQAWMLKMGLVSIAIAPLLRALDPLHLIAMEHVMFITGFGLTIYAVAARVAFGHSGHLEQTKRMSKSLRWLVWLAVLAMVTRVSADYKASIQASHYFYAALTWVIVTAIWFGVVGKKLGMKGEE